MRLTCSLLALCFLAWHAAECAGPVLAFQRGADIWVTNLAEAKPRKIAAGDWPAVSPDGTRVAYNTQKENSPERHIAFTDIATGKETILKGIPSNNCHSPVWSPDGSKLVFQIFAGGDWHIGLCGADGSNFRYVKKAGSDHRSYWNASWAPDGKSLFCQDMDSILRIGLDGSVLQKWKLEDLVGQAGTFSSGSHVAVSPDGKTLLFDLDMDEEVKLQDWEGPPPSIWKVNLSGGKAERVTPKGVHAWQPCWISKEEFLYTTVPGKKIFPFQIQRWSLADGKTSLVVKDGSASSLSELP